MSASHKDNLAVGKIAFVTFGRGKAPLGDGNNIRSGPGKDQDFLCTAKPGAVVEIIGGPRNDLGDGMTWWQVFSRIGCGRKARVTGWTSDGKKGDHWLTPIKARPVAQDKCNASLGTRLQVGQRAYVIDPLGKKRPNMIRLVAHPKATVVGKAAIGDLVRIVRGPECVENMAWWLVESEATPVVRGWMSEGNPADGENGYYLVPVAVPAPAPAPHGAPLHSLLGTDGGEKGAAAEPVFGETPWVVYDLMNRPGRLWLGNIDLSGLFLRGAILTKADMEQANLQGSDLTEADLQEAFLYRANLQGTNLTTANLEKAVLAEADLSNATLLASNLRRARLMAAQLWAADLWGADLEMAELSGANLRCAKLSFTHLHAADLTGAQLQEADLEGADLSHAGLYGATYNDDTKWPEGFDPEAAGAIKLERGGPCPSDENAPDDGVGYQVRRRTGDASAGEPPSRASRARSGVRP